MLHGSKEEQHRVDTENMNYATSRVARQVYQWLGLEADGAGQRSLSRWRSVPGYCCSSCPIKPQYRWSRRTFRAFLISRFHLMPPSSSSCPACAGAGS